MGRRFSHALYVDKGLKVGLVHSKVPHRSCHGHSGGFVSVPAHSNGSGSLSGGLFAPRLVAGLFASLVAALGLVLDVLNINPVETLDKFVGDHRLAWLSSQAKAQRQDIAVVLVTEETLLDYESRSPISRTLLAELVKAIDAARPKAIGLDIIFDRRTAQDALLVAAVRRARAPIVLGAID